MVSSCLPSLGFMYPTLNSGRSAIPSYTLRAVTVSSQSTMVRYFERRGSFSILMASATLRMATFTSWGQPILSAVFLISLPATSSLTTTSES